MKPTRGSVVRAPRRSGRRWSRAVLVACLLLGSGFAQEVRDAEEIGAPAGLHAPTSPLYADPAWYDLVAVRWVEPDTTSLWLEIELAAVDVGGVGALGLRQPIVEVYVDDGGGGAATLLSGSGLRMPDGDGWRQAVRVTGDGVWWWEATVDGRGLLPPRQLPAVVEGRVVRIAWPTARPVDARLYAIAGVHDPFSADGWRPMGTEPSPWAFASDVPGPPVVDVLPGGHEVLRKVRETGALVRPSDPGTEDRGVMRWRWWVLMGIGLGLASAGLWWRSRPPLASSQAAGAVEAPRSEAPAFAAKHPVPGASESVLPAEMPRSAADLGLLISDDELSEPACGRAGEGGDADAAGHPERPNDTAEVSKAASKPPEPSASADDGEATSTRSTAAPSADSRSAKRS